jgi:hypothetical protein
MHWKINLMHGLFPNQSDVDISGIHPLKVKAELSELSILL